MPGTTQSVWLRVLISTTIGVAMAGITFESAFRGMRDASAYEDSHREAFRNVTLIRESLEAFRKESGRYPRNLADLKGTRSDSLETDSSGRVLDPWKHPFEYSSDGQRYTLRSLGLDGKPGGLGLARDLDAREIVLRDKVYEFPRHDFRPTFWQYTFNLNTTTPVKVACALAGLFAAVACFVTLGNQHIRRANMLGRLFITLLMCCFITSIITALHTPSHH
ncbi:type II secretion system protein GspG [Singulisphaera sp. Ch08]|uniref:Type II secretion system protein GspG n=1 Tax=Singulisphaera sp. Ch08 TaxID=3120278 RepID=A0AAU7CMX4_9BACT